jgi:hypothetical protein
MSIKYIFFIIAIQFLTLSTASSKEKSPAENPGNVALAK